MLGTDHTADNTTKAGVNGAGTEGSEAQPLPKPGTHLDLVISFHCTFGPHDRECPWTVKGAIPLGTDDTTQESAQDILQQVANSLAFVSPTRLHRMGTSCRDWMSKLTKTARDMSIEFAQQIKCTPSFVQDVAADDKRVAASQPKRVYIEATSS